MAGHPPEVLVTLCAWDISSHRPAEGWRAYVGQVRAAGTMTFGTEMRPAQGTLLPVEITSSYCAFDGQDYLVSYVRDRIAQVQVAETLQWEVDYNHHQAEISAELLPLTDIDEVCSVVLRHARALTGSQHGFVGYIDPDTGWMISPTMTRDTWDVCQIPDKDFVFKHFGGLWGWVANHRTAVLCNDLACELRATGAPPGHIPIQRFLSAPVLLGAELVGQVALANPERDYAPRDLLLIERISHLMGLTVQRLRIEHERQEIEKRFRSAVLN